jgi:maltooligosyltrehalose trehalohydrolase
MTDTVNIIHGHHYNGNTCTFRVWAPAAKRMVLHIVHPEDLKVEMHKDEEDYFETTVSNIDPDARYYFMPDGKEDVPDPASNYQPEGISGPSMLVNHTAFLWEDSDWQGIPQEELMLYEIHVGTYTEEGTFEAVIGKLDHLMELGINAIEIMPVAQFSGSRNWGYDGVLPYAAQHSYGGPEGLKRLVNACHKKGIAVFLDVVYNHFGPEGNYFDKYGYYVTDTYKTPWGGAVNYDGPWSDAVRDFISDNVIYWLRHFHLDGLRFDAIHAIFDSSAQTIWALIDKKRKLLEKETGKQYILIAESDLNNPQVIQDIGINGFGFDAQWLDDFHHAVYVLLDKNGQEYYEDFGLTEQVTKAINEGFVHSGEYVTARKRKYGTSSKGIAGNRFVIFNQNHDQVGNRSDGARIVTLTGDKQYKMAAALLMLSPYIPLLFMGEEYGESAPFLYFINHTDPQLIKAVREGRKKEFEKFYKNSEPYDPQDISTFTKSKLNWDLPASGKNKEILDWYKKLIILRKEHPALKVFDKSFVNAFTIGKHGLGLLRWDEPQLHHLFAVFNFGDIEMEVSMPSKVLHWKILLSTDENINGMNDYLPNASVKISPYATVIFSSN